MVTWSVTDLVPLPWYILRPVALLGMLWLLGLLLIHELINAMRLPLVNPIEGFTKCDEFLLNSRASLKDSRFHFYVAPKEGPLAFAHLFSLSESMY
jgi:hypothetical protein